MSRSHTLTGRLAAIAELIPEGKAFIDIGSDHALLPVTMVACGRVPWAIASDRRPGPLAAAHRTLALHDLGAQVILRLADGLAGFEAGEVEVAVVAGMGPDRMIALLTADPGRLWSLGRLILQPNFAAWHTRRWLVSAGWTLVDERLALERGRFYTVLAAEPRPAGPPTYSDAELRFGPFLRRRRGGLYERSLAAELRRCEVALGALRGAPLPDGARLAELAALRSLLLAELVAEAPTPAAW
ncbi:MAG: class I SAM-dependent methyltransferase [Nannocystaceae bacterium]